MKNVLRRVEDGVTTYRDAETIKFLSGIAFFVGVLIGLGVGLCL